MADQFQRQPQGQTPSSEVQIQALREGLDAANKKVDRYVSLVATLSEELDNLRRGICHNCKKKFVPSCSPTASSSGGPRPSLWRRIVSERQTHSPSSGLPPVLPPDARDSLGTSIPVHPVTTLQNQEKTRPISPPPQASQSSATLRQPSNTPVNEIQSIQPDWSITHNPEIKQGLHVDLIKTFNLTTRVSCLKFSPHGKYLAVGDNLGKTCIYDVEKRLNICDLVDYSLKVQPTIWDVQFSPDSQYVAVGSDGRIKIWGIAHKRTISMFMRFSSIVYVYSTSFSPDGRFLVSSDSRGSICKWRIRDGYTNILMPTNNPLCVSVSFSPNGLYIASVHINGDLRIWEARTNQLIHKWMGHLEYAFCMAFTPDGRGLVSGGEDKTLKYWDVSPLVHSQSGQGSVDRGKFKQILRLEGHTQAIRSVAVCPDNRWIATSSDDGSGIRIWNARTATWQHSMQRHTSYGHTVDFSPAGRYLASGSEDGQVTVWKYRNA